MTFGVDQCRRCGKPITASGPDAMERYLEEKRRRKPTMPEREWRAMGLKTGPTHLQTWRRIDGCCFDCQFPMGSSIINTRKLLIAGIGGAVTLIIVIYLIGSNT